MLVHFDDIIYLFMPLFMPKPTHMELYQQNIKQNDNNNNNPKARGK